MNAANLNQVALISFAHCERPISFQNRCILLLLKVFLSVKESLDAIRFSHTPRWSFKSLTPHIKMAEACLCSVMSGAGQTFELPRLLLSAEGNHMTLFAQSLGVSAILSSVKMKKKGRQPVNSKRIPFFSSKQTLPLQSKQPHRAMFYLRAVFKVPLKWRLEPTTLMIQGF